MKIFGIRMGREPGYEGHLAREEEERRLAWEVMDEIHRKQEANEARILRVEGAVAVLAAQVGRLDKQ